MVPNNPSKSVNSRDPIRFFDVPITSVIIVEFRVGICNICKYITMYVCIIILIADAQCADLSRVVYIYYIIYSTYLYKHHCTIIVRRRAKVGRPGKHG